MDFVTFALIIDDIVFPDGQTAMGLLGGGGPQTAFGARLFAERVGLVGGVGQDLPSAARAWLSTMGIDTAGLRPSVAHPTPRAWQLTETDGRRTQVWRIPPESRGPQLRRDFGAMPASYQAARGYHLGVHPEDADLAFIRQLRETGAVVSVEPFRAAHRAMTEAELDALCAAGQIFSPNLEEAISLVGMGEPMTLIERLASHGAEIIALRQGADGATVYHAATGKTWHIPALETRVVDATGAGNAFCGGFLAGWVQTGDLKQAGVYGSVAASFLVEQIGLPAAEAFDFKTEAVRRAAQVLASVRPLK